jgi:hypothetical protein
MAMSKEIPKTYLDGCTFFPDKFGKISHKYVCDIHDIDYWLCRTLISKIMADIRWTIGLNKAHRKNTFFWRVVVLFASIVGFMALSTGGLYFWKIRHMWDN